MYIHVLHVCTHKKVRDVIVLYMRVCADIYFDLFLLLDIHIHIHVHTDIMRTYIIIQQF